MYIWLSPKWKGLVQYKPKLRKAGGTLATIMKKYIKYLICFLILCSIFILYFYSKPPVEINRIEIEKRIPIKISRYYAEEKNDISLVLFLPYKIEIKNNRLKRIEFGQIDYKHNSDEVKDMYFDKNGFIVGRVYNNLDSLLYNREYLKCYSIYHNKEIFPFCNEQYYIYIPYIIKSNCIIGNLNSKKLHELAIDFINNQFKNLFNGSKFKVKKQIIDSLYHYGNNSEVFFRLDPLNSSDFGSYSIQYNFATDKQILEDYTKISSRQLLREELINK